VEANIMTHEVRAKLDTKLIAHKDLEITVRTGDGMLGTLLISKGNIEWRPKGNSVNKRQLSWKKFAALIEEKGKEVKIK
jgi:hypothetical protein